MTRIANIYNWLTPRVNSSVDGKYRHQLLLQNPREFASVKDELRAYFQEAHRDAKEHYYNLIGISLSPLSSSSPPTAIPYPEGLPIRVLQNYFGEIFAGIAAEHFSPFAEDSWEVPAFLLRFHNVLFEQLEKANRTGETLPQSLPGRTGDDCLAFIRNEQGQIEKVLYCEAKCLSAHRSDKVKEAHEKLCSVFNSIFQLIEVLQGREDGDAARWIEELRQLRMRHEGVDYEQCNFCCYITGDAPQRGDSWISSAIPHSSYASDKRLEVVELHLEELLDVISETYNS